MAKRNSYDDSSIEALKGATRIRKRPASVLGSSGIEGARHGFTEIYGNSLDEISSGYGDKLDVHYYEDGSISVRDYGRGVPLGWNEKVHNWNWHNIYNELYAGGKYENNQDKLAQVTNWDDFNPQDYNYLFSVGLNGLGAASTQYTSEFFQVKSYRDGKCISRSFEKGMPLVNGVPFDMFSATEKEIRAIKEEVEKTDEPNGTYVHWKPDSTVFSNVNIGGEWLLSVCEDISGVAGIDLNFIDDINGVEKHFQKGTLVDVVKAHAGENLIDDVVLRTKGFTHGNIIVEGKPFIYVCMANIAIGFTSDTVKSTCYHNSVKMMGGIQYDAIDDALYEFLRDEVKKINSGLKIDRRDYSDATAVVVSTYSNYASFRNQTKDAVDDDFIYTTIKDALLKELKEENGKNNKSVKDFVGHIAEIAERRLMTEEFAKNLKKNDKLKRQKEPDKFVSCTAYEKKEYHKAELWITEGDSALGAVKNARNKDFQALFPIRGKGLNVSKHNISKILANKEISEIFGLIGTGIDIQLGKEKGDNKILDTLKSNGIGVFDIDNLRFNKIIFATDADEDGYQIRVLLFLTFYYLAPRLITEGHIYIAESPRFRIVFNDGTFVYAHNDEARDEVIAKEGSRIKTITRYKGLGEVDPKILRDTTVHPKTRQLIPVNCDFANRTERDFIDALFGTDPMKQRKGIISAVLGVNSNSEDIDFHGDISVESSEDVIEDEVVTTETED